MAVRGVPCCSLCGRSRRPPHGRRAGGARRAGRRGGARRVRALRRGGGDQERVFREETRVQSTRGTSTTTCPNTTRERARSTCRIRGNERHRRQRQGSTGDGGGGRQAVAPAQRRRHPAGTQARGDMRVRAGTTHPTPRRGTMDERQKRHLRQREHHPQQKKDQRTSRTHC